MSIKPLILMLLLTTISNAAIEELTPKLASKNPQEQTAARRELRAMCSKATAPDADAAERDALTLEIAAALSENPPVVLVALPLMEALERIGDENAVPVLAKILSSGDERARDAARRALVANSSPLAGKAIAAQLKSRASRSPIETAGLIMALGERGDAGASNLIAPFATAKDDVVAFAAIDALGRLNEDAGIKALAQARKKATGSRKTRLDAALCSTDRMAVFEMMLATSEEPHARSIALLGALLGGKTELAAPALASSDAAARRAVIEAAVQTRSSALLDPLAARLGALPSDEQPRALVALERSGKTKYAKSIQPLLASDDAATRKSAARALARVGTAESVPPLLAQGDSASLHALGELNAEGVDAALEKVATASDDGALRVGAINALAMRGRVDLAPLFLKLSADNDETVSAAAINAVGAVGDVSDVEPLTSFMLRHEQSRVSRDALNAIVEITRRSTEQEKAIEVLVRHLDGASPRSQSNILKALVQTASVDALEPLVSACRSSDEQLSATAIKLLGGWPDANGLPTMITLAADESLSLSDHVVLMRGVSRLLAAQRRDVDVALAREALAACRRDEERSAIQTSISNAR